MDFCGDPYIPSYTSHKKKTVLNLGLPRNPPPDNTADGEKSGVHRLRFVVYPIIDN